MKAIMKGPDGKWHGRPQDVVTGASRMGKGSKINTDLLALKEVIRAWNTNAARNPFRNSALKMVLREHFVEAV